MFKYIIYLNFDTFSFNEFCHSSTFIYIMLWAIRCRFIVMPIGVEMYYISFLLNYFLSWCHNATVFNFLDKGKGFSSPFKISYNSIVGKRHSLGWRGTTLNPFILLNIIIFFLLFVIFINITTSSLTYGSRLYPKKKNLRWERYPSPWVRKTINRRFLILIRLHHYDVPI